MVSTGNIRAGRAFVELFADDSKLVRGLRRAQAKLKAFGESVRTMGLKLAGLGAAMVAPLLASAKVFSTMGDRLAKMSARTGFSVESLSELGFAAELSGASMEDLEKSIRRMQATVVDAGQGLSTATDALATLGLKVEDLSGLSPEKQFKLIADRLAKIEDPTLRAATAMEIFGRSGTMLLPMLSAGAAGIEELQTQARALGLTISTADAKAAERFTDTLTVLWKVLKQGVFLVGSALAPVLSQAARWITRIGISAADWIKRNKELIVTVLKVAVCVVAAGAALVVAGTAISGLGQALGVLAGVVTTAGTVFKVLGGILAWMLSPIGLVVTAVAALAGYLLYASGAAADALGWLGKKFVELKALAVGAYQGIGDALAAGDIALAAKILWQSLKLAWLDGTQELRMGWHEAWRKIQEIAATAWTGIRAVITTILHGITVAIIEAVALWDKSITRVGGFLSEVKNTAKMIGREIAIELDTSLSPQEKARRIQESRVQGHREFEQIDEKRAKALQDAETARAALRKQAGQDYDESMDRIGKEGAETLDRIRKEQDVKRKAVEEALRQARKDWEDSLAEARRKRQSVAASDGGPGRLKTPDELADRLAGLGDLLAKKTVAVTGTFNAAALLGLQAGGMEDRIANATERTAKGVEGLRQDVKNNRPAFV